MDTNQNDYHVSFFKPVSPRALKNRNMIIWLILIWAIAVFGFQILLRVIQKPVPEPAYNTFISVWENVKSETADEAQLKNFASSLLYVLGKVYIKPEYEAAMSNGFTWALFQLAGDEKEKLYLDVVNFEKQKLEGSGLLDPAYIESKKVLEEKVCGMLDIDATDARKLIIPFSLSSENYEVFSEENKKITEKGMPFYLIHNRSVLTDTKFLGFPFHYFYSAVFLLILFIGLCWIYCIITDKIERKETAARQF